MLWKRNYYNKSKKMVQKMKRNSDYIAYIAAFKTFIADVIAPLCGGSGVVYQCPPTLRIHMPGHVPTITMHRDADFANHESGEINFWVPFVDVFGSNTLWCESLPGKGDFEPFELKAGEGKRFDGNGCRHYTMANRTDVTRVSIDFRVIPREVAVRPDSFKGKIGDYDTEVYVQSDSLN